MTSGRRQSGDRRWGLHVEFPLVDSAGMRIAEERRRLADRRKARVSMQEMRALLAQLAANDSDGDS
jgi:hypothetical protein